MALLSDNCTGCKSTKCACNRHVWEKAIMAYNVHDDIFNCNKIKKFLNSDEPKI
jgi:hypothetical protein